MSTCEQRYYRRLEVWKASRRAFPRLRHHFWWLLHNLAAHPVLAFTQSSAAIWLHDYTSMKLNNRAEIRPSPPAIIQPESRKAWIIHNLFGHLAIGLFPVEVAFRFHDRGAVAMGVEDWL